MARQRPYVSILVAALRCFVLKGFVGAATSRAFSFCIVRSCLAGLFSGSKSKTLVPTLPCVILIRPQLTLNPGAIHEAEACGRCCAFERVCAGAVDTRTRGNSERKSGGRFHSSGSGRHC